MAQIEIPEPWRKKVCAILATEETGTLIEWTDDAEDEFQASFVGTWQSQMYAAFQMFFEGNRPTGCPVQMKKSAGETYEFLFKFKGKVTYGKILLRPDQQRITVFSAHLPEKPKLSCDDTRTKASI